MFVCCHGALGLTFVIGWVELFRLQDRVVSFGCIHIILSVSMDTHQRDEATVLER